MTDKTYNEIIVFLKNYYNQLSVTEPKVLLIVKNMLTHSNDTIINNCSKVYNRAIVVYDPNNSVSINAYAGDDRAHYICHTLEEVETTTKFLLDNLDSWIIDIDESDILEQF